MAARHRPLDYQRLFESLPTAVMVLDPDLRIVRVNAAFTALSGSRSAEIAGRPLFEVFPDDPDDPAATGVGNLRASLRRVSRHGVVDVMPIQKYALARDGRYEAHYWTPTNAPVPAADGSLGWIVQTVDDVTAFVHERTNDAAQRGLVADLRRQTSRTEAAVHQRQRLQEQNQILHAVLDSLDTAVVGCDRHGRAVLTNQSARDLFRLPDGEEAAEGWARRFTCFDYADEHGTPLSPEELPTARLLRGEVVQNMLVVAKAAGAPVRTFRIHGQPVTDGGHLAGVIALHEVTVEQRAKQLRRCEARIAELLHRPEPADGLLAGAVELIGGMLGWTATEFWTVDDVGQVLRRQAAWTAAGYTEPGDRPDRLAKGAAVPGQAWGSSRPLWTTDLRHDHLGEAGPLRAALAVPIPNGAATLGVLVCYSDHEQIPDDLRAAVLTGIAAHVGEFLERRRAEQYSAELESSRDEYIALVGHELRTPLTSIAAYTDMMRGDAGLSAADRAAMLEVMHRNATKLHTLIEKLLDVAGTRAGHIGLRLRRTDLAAIAHDCAARARSAGPAARIAVDTGPKVIIDGDPGRLCEVVDELVGNAVTWAPGGSTVGVTVRADDHTAVLSVSNTGERIPAGEQGRVFDLFYRTGDALRSGRPGHGLGLALARAVVEQHGGTITVSEPAAPATTFTVRLPTRQPAGR